MNAGADNNVLLVYVNVMQYFLRLSLHIIRLELVMVNTFWYVQFTFSSVYYLRFRMSTVSVFARDLFVLELETDQFRLPWKNPGT
jgi:hypothetical protein